MKINIKTFFILFVTSIISLTNISANEVVINLLDSKSWKDIDRAISLVKKDLIKYKGDDSVKQKILKIFEKETKILREMKAPGQRPVKYGKGPGELLGDLMFLIIKLEISESIPVLVDWLDTSKYTRKTVVKHLESEESHDLSTFNLIKDRFFSSEPFYVRRKSGMLRTVCEYLDSSNLVFRGKKGIVKKMLIDQLKIPEFYYRKNAIVCTKHFFSDLTIMKELKSIAENDPYSYKKKGSQFYPVREEAKKLLNSIEKN